MWKVGLRPRSAKQCISQRSNSELSFTGRAPRSAPGSRLISDLHADERILERNAARKLDHNASQQLHPRLQHRFTAMFAMSFALQLLISALAFADEIRIP